MSATPKRKRRPGRGGVYPKLGGERMFIPYEISPPQAIPGRILLTHWLRPEAEA